MKNKRTKIKPICRGHKGSINSKTTTWFYNFTSDMLLIEKSIGQWLNFTQKEPTMEKLIGYVIVVKLNIIKNLVKNNLIIFIFIFSL